MYTMDDLITKTEQLHKLVLTQQVLATDLETSLRAYVASLLDIADSLATQKEALEDVIDKGVV